MNLHIEFTSAVITEIRALLNECFPSMDAIPKPFGDEVKLVADRVRASVDASTLRSYLLNYIAQTSALWRKLAPYTNYNKLLSRLEMVVNLPEYSPQAIQVAQITHLHQYYLGKQNELIVPLQREIHSLRRTCHKLQSTVSTLREENRRLRVENEFFIKEIVSIQTRFADMACDANFSERSCKEESLANSMEEITYESNSNAIAAF